jgi:heme exporter protein C
MIIARLSLILIPVSIFLAFMWAPPAKILGDASRIIYFHVPMAWGAVLAFMVSGILSILYLIKRNPLNEQKAYNSAHIGMIYTVLAVISGSLWAKISWGSYWNWDPRETSITVLLLIYVAYFALRSAVEDQEKKGVIASAYLIFAMAVMPFLIFVIPRINKSLHPDTIINTNKKMQMDVDMRIVLFTSVIAFTLLYVYIFKLKNRLSIIEAKIEHKIEEGDN